MIQRSAFWIHRHTYIVYLLRHKVYPSVRNNGKIPNSCYNILCAVTYYDSFVWNEIRVQWWFIEQSVTAILIMQCNIQRDESFVESIGMRSCVLSRTIPFFSFVFFSIFFLNPFQSGNDYARCSSHSSVLNYVLFAANCYH